MWVDDECCVCVMQRIRSRNRFGQLLEFRVVQRSHAVEIQFDVVQIFGTDGSLIVDHRNRRRSRRQRRFEFLPARMSRRHCRRCARSFQRIGTDRRMVCGRRMSLVSELKVQSQFAEFRLGQHVRNPFDGERSRRLRVRFTWSWSPKSIISLTINNLTNRLLKLKRRLSINLTRNFNYRYKFNDYWIDHWTNPFNYQSIINSGTIQNK